MDKLFLANTVSSRMSPLHHEGNFGVGCIMSYLIMGISGYQDYMVFTYKNLLEFDVYGEICKHKLHIKCASWWCADLRSIPVIIEWSKDRDKRIFIG